MFRGGLEAMDELLKKLSDACRSIREMKMKVRNIILNGASKYAEVHIDSIGNVIAYKKVKLEIKRLCLHLIWMKSDLWFHILKTTAL